MTRFLLCLLLALALPATAAPVMVPGEPAAARSEPAPRLRLARGVARHAQLPNIAAQALAEVREVNRRAAAARAFEATPRRVAVGVVHGGAPLPGAADLAWLPVAGGFAAQVAITSPQAQSVRLAISLAGVPTDVEMVFFGSADPARLEGPVRVGDIPDRIAPWWSPLTEGQTQTVEFFVPGLHAPRALPLRIADASHLLTAPSSGLDTKSVQDIGTADWCNVNAPCSRLASDAAFRNAAESVAKMLFRSGSTMVLCTGTLLNDADPGSQVPYFYGANHCFENDSPPYKTADQMQAVASTLSTFWGFEAAGCSGTALSQPRPGWTQRSGGATFLYNNPQLDVLLLRLNEAPPTGAFYSGWDARTVSAGTPAITIHHPDGDLRKVTEGTVRALAAPGVSVGGSSVPLIQVSWSLGSTEGGSSGAGLFTSGAGGYLFRGGLWGGDAFCHKPAGFDYYSRFDMAYAEMARYLGSGSADIDYTDLWWNPAESGWGLNLIQHPSRMIFGVWYTYAPDGKRTWFVIPSGQWVSDNTYTGPVYQTTGPSASSSPFDASKVVRRPVGSATLTFGDRNNATFTYDIDGASGSRSITRQPF